ncbi:MAG: hypothetical protein AAGH67_15935 [Cyanobacteria bacterium P01_H01_bin.162]
MIDPVFWLVLSFVLVSVSLTAVLVVLVPAVRELSRAARSVEKLCDTLNHDLPPTLEAIRLTSVEINGLTDDVNEGVQNAGRVVQHVDESVSTMRVQAKRAQIGTRTLVAGLSTAWATFTQPATNGDRPTGQPAKPTLNNPPPHQKAQPIVEPSSSVSPTPAPLPDSNPVPPSSMPSTETQQLAAQPQTATDAPGNSEIP